METLQRIKLSEASEALSDPIEYRKSGLSLNHIIGCPLDCSYCIRHEFGNYEMKKPHLLMSDEEAVERLITNKYFRPHRTPIQIFNRATDPFLPNVKPHTFNTLALLDKHGFTNHTLIITRLKVDALDCEALNQFKSLKISLLFTYSGIDNSEIEPINSMIAIESLKSAYKAPRSYRVLLYWRPIVPGLNDSEKHITNAARYSHFADATVFSGLFFRESIMSHWRDNELPIPYPNIQRRKILPLEHERELLNVFYLKGGRTIFRKTSCGIAFAYGEPDYNGHFCISEICDICPRKQFEICAAHHTRPSEESIKSLCREVAIDGNFTISDRRILFDNVPESKRYFIQHATRYQVHDARYPHERHRHGRGGIELSLLIKR